MLGSERLGKIVATIAAKAGVRMQHGDEQDETKGVDPGYPCSPDPRRNPVALDHDNTSDPAETETTSEDDLSE